MIKDITHNTRTKFKKTFLKNVQFLILYPSADIKDKENMIKGELKKKGFEVKSGGEPFGIVGKKNKTGIIVTSKGVSISIDKEDYKDYEHFKGTIEFIVSMLIEVGVKECSNLVFQKQNSFKVNKAAGMSQYTKEQIFHTLFTHKITDNAPIFGINEDSYIYTVQPQYKDENDFSLAELLVSAMCFKTIELKKIIDLTDEINDNLYDLWYASVTDAVKAMMQ